MPRPKKCRRVGFIPEIHYFKPCHEKDSDANEVVLTIEELEAVRLSDLEGLEQDKSAESMNISRGTLQRILGSARQKIADALINGKAISIEGGSYTRGNCSLICKKCSSVWSNAGDVDGDVCPKCGNTEVYCCEKQRKCRSACRRHNGDPGSQSE